MPSKLPWAWRLWLFKLSSEEYKSGLVYGIKVKDDKGNFIPISKEDALKILKEDIKEKGRITKVEYENKTGKKFSDLSKTIQDVPHWSEHVAHKALLQ